MHVFTVWVNQWWEWNSSAFLQPKAWRCLSVRWKWPRLRLLKITTTINVDSLYCLEQCNHLFQNHPGAWFCDLWFREPLFMVSSHILTYSVLPWPHFLRGLKLTVSPRTQVVTLATLISCPPSSDHSPFLLELPSNLQRGNSMLQSHRVPHWHLMLCDWRQSPARGQ